MVMAKIVTVTITATTLYLISDIALSISHALFRLLKSPRRVRKLFSAVQMRRLRLQELSNLVKVKQPELGQG